MSDALERHEWNDAVTTLVRARPGLSTAEVACEVGTKDVDRLAETLWREGRGMGLGQHADGTWWSDKDSAVVRARRAWTGGVVTVRPPHIDNPGAEDDKAGHLATWDWPLTVMGDPDADAAGQPRSDPS